MIQHSCIFLLILACFQLHGYCFFAGPDAVKYIVNHAAVQAIFCVHETLNLVSPL